MWRFVCRQSNTGKGPVRTKEDRFNRWTYCSHMFIFGKRGRCRQGSPTRHDGFEGSLSASDRVHPCFKNFCVIAWLVKITLFQKRRHLVSTWSPPALAWRPSLCWSLTLLPLAQPTVRAKMRTRDTPYFLSGSPCHHAAVAPLQHAGPSAHHVLEVTPQELPSYIESTSLDATTGASD